jgi:urease accessory protein
MKFIPLSFILAVVGGFAVFHGYAHGMEMHHANGLITYALGFVVATMLLHITGFIFASGVMRIWDRLGAIALKLFAASISLGGVTMLIGIFP